MRNELHKEALSHCVEAKERGAFTDKWNPERGFWIQDITEIITELKKHLTEIELEIVLTDCRYISDKEMSQYIESSMTDAEDVRDYKSLNQ